MVDARLPKEGSLLVNGPLSEAETQQLIKSLQDQILYQVYGRKGISFDYNNPQHTEPLIRALSDKAYREQLLGPMAHDTVWRKDNTRDPVWSKSCGMIDIHYNPILLQLIAFNQTVYANLASYYGYDKLTHRVGLEKVCIKAPGSTVMEAHLDANLFDNKINYPVRLQSFICLQIDNTASPKDNGSIETLDYFHLYWYLARALFHPQHGPCPFVDKTGKKLYGSRFHILPKDFNTKYLPQLHYHITHYTGFYYDGVTPPDSRWATVYSQWKMQGITVPRDINLPVWVAKSMVNDNQLDDGTPNKNVKQFIWSQRTPHRSRPNKTDTPRIVAYVSLFPVDDSWYGTEEHLYLVKQVSQNQFFYQINHDQYPANPVVKNPEEMEYLKLTNQMESIQQLFCRSIFNARLVGLAKYE